MAQWGWDLPEPPGDGRGPQRCRNLPGPIPPLQMERSGGPAMYRSFSQSLRLTENALMSQSQFRSAPFVDDAQHRQDLSMGVDAMTSMRYAPAQSLLTSSVTRPSTHTSMRHAPAQSPLSTGGSRQLSVGQRSVLGDEGGSLGAQFPNILEAAREPLSPDRFRGSSAGSPRKNHVPDLPLWSVQAKTTSIDRQVADYQVPTRMPADRKYQSGYGNREEGKYQSGYGTREEGKYQSGYGNREEGKYQSGYGNREEWKYQSGYGNRLGDELGVQFPNTSEMSRKPISPEFFSRAEEGRRFEFYEIPGGFDVRQGAANTYTSSSESQAFASMNQSLQTNGLAMWGGPATFLNAAGEGAFSTSAAGGRAAEAAQRINVVNTGERLERLERLVEKVLAGSQPDTHEKEDAGHLNATQDYGAHHEFVDLPRRRLVITTVAEAIPSARQVPSPAKVLPTPSPSNKSSIRDVPSPSTMLSTPVTTDGNASLFSREAKRTNIRDGPSPMTSTIRSTPVTEDGNASTFSRGSKKSRSCEATYEWTDVGLLGMPIETAELLGNPRAGDVVTAKAANVLKEWGRWDRLKSGGGVVSRAKVMYEWTAVGLDGMPAETAELLGNPKVGDTVTWEAVDMLSKWGRWELLRSSEGVVIKAMEDAEPKGADLARVSAVEPLRRKLFVEADGNAAPVALMLSKEARKSPAAQAYNSASLPSSSPSREAKKFHTGEVYANEVPLASAITEEARKSAIHEAGTDALPLASYFARDARKSPLGDANNNASQFASNSASDARKSPIGGAIANLSSFAPSPSRPSIFSFTGRTSLRAPKDAVLAWIKDEMDAQKSCSSLPFTCVFWLVFVCTQLAHRQVQLAYEIQSFTASQLSSAVLRSSLMGINSNQTFDQSSSAIGGRRLVVAANSGSSSGSGSAVGGGALGSARKGQVEESGLDLGAIDSYLGIYDWVNQTLVRLAWAGQIEPGVAFISSFNRVIGGARLQQFRLNIDGCPGSDEIRNHFKATCYSRDDKKNKTSLGTQWHGFTPNGDGLMNYWLDIYQQEEETQAHISFLRQAPWMDVATHELRAQIVMYNEQVALFVYADTTFQMDLSGQLVAKPNVKVLPTEVYNSVGMIVGDAVMVALLAWLAMGEIAKFCLKWKEGRARSYIHVYSVVNWTVVLQGIGLVVFFAWLTTRLDDLEDDVEAVTAPQFNTTYSPGSNAWANRHHQLDVLYDNMASLADVMNAAEFFTFAYTLVLVFKFFEAFHGNPRLAVLSQTFLQSTADLGHYLVVFFAIFFNFALGGYFMFGHQIQEWSNLLLANMTCFRALMGDFNFNDMYVVAPVSATIWFVSFMVLLFLVMLNMLLAIVMDVYTEVKEKSKKQISVVRQATLVLQGLRLKAEAARVAMSRGSSRLSKPGLPVKSEHSITSFAGLKKVLETVEDDRDITTNHLIDMGLSANFANHLMNQLLTSHGSDKGICEDNEFDVPASPAVLQASPLETQASPEQIVVDPQEIERVCQWLKRQVEALEASQQSSATQEENLGAPTPSVCSEASLVRDVEEKRISDPKLEENLQMPGYFADGEGLYQEFV